MRRGIWMALGATAGIGGALLVSRRASAASPAAPGWLLNTAATCASQPSTWQACWIACMFEPRPEIRITMRFMGARV